MKGGISFRKGANLPSGILEISKFGGTEHRLHATGDRIAGKGLLIVIPILNRSG